MNMSEPPEFVELRELERYLQSEEYGSLSEEEKLAFIVKYRSAEANARRASGRKSREI